MVFARQPGTFAVVFDHSGRDAPQTIASIAGRHFFGHGVFSPDGALLYATENDFDNAAGVVGVYDARAKFSRVGEFPTYGMTPRLRSFISFAAAEFGVVAEDQASEVGETSGLVRDFDV